MKYHKICYGSYTRNLKKPEFEGATRYDGYEAAFTQLVGRVDEKVFDNMDIMKMTELRDTYFDMLEEADLDAQNYHTEKLKTRFRSRSTTVTDWHFGSHTTRRKHHFLKACIWCTICWQGGQDLVHCVSSGRVMTPVTVKHLTGSSQLVEVLNHFGHSLLKSLIQEVEIAMTERHIGLVEDGAIYTTPSIKPNVPAVMCLDNTNINEETLSGHDTTHCTNGIIIQRAVHTSGATASGPRARTTSTRGKRKRSFTPQPSRILPYIAGTRCSPGNMAISDEDLRSPEFPNSLGEARWEDTAWLMLRCRHDDGNDDAPQKVPGWSGFNAAVSSNTPAPSVVGYYPVIEASPTERLTVYTLLKKSMEMGRKLGLDEIIIVIDNMLYMPKRKRLSGNNKRSSTM